MSKPWGGIGAWAAEAEREEALEKAAAAAAAAATVASESQSFPSLREATAAAKTGKKKKGISMSLGEFNSAGAGSLRPGDSVGLTPEEMMRLPTGPKERSSDEMQLGRGFSSYGRQGISGRRGRDRPYGGGFDEERRSGASSRVSEFDQVSSRADEVESWKTEKKSLPSRSGGGFGWSSRADEADNWAFGKKAPASRPSNFGYGGFRDSDQTDRWRRGGIGGGGGGFRDGESERERERPRLVLDPRKANASPAAEAKASRPSPFGAARPREEVLAEKGLDWKKVDSEIEAKKGGSRPTSAHSSRPSSAQSESSRPKMNPFGDAKPREVLLEEKGMDWRKIDLDLERRRGVVDRPETEEEKMLKEEIKNLKNELNDHPQDPSGEEPSLQDRILQREAKLEQLTRDLDNKLRFAQKGAERPRSGAGRSGGPIPYERPPSQSGSYVESRSAEFMERPLSRGTSDIWTRPGEDRRSISRW